MSVRTSCCGQPAVCLFFAFLQSSEMTVPTGNSFDPSWHMTPKDIAVDSLEQPSYIQIMVKGSKTDQTRQGVRLYVGKTNNDLCPVSAVLTYLVRRGINNGPLFRTEDGLPLIQQKLIDLLRSTLAAAGINPSRFSSHSFVYGQQQRQQQTGSVTRPFKP